jgi:hypothetical protein
MLEFTFMSAQTLCPFPKSIRTAVVVSLSADALGIAATGTSNNRQIKDVTMSFI